MRWENPNVQRSWSWADDVTDDLKRTSYETHTPNGMPHEPWRKPNICLFSSYEMVN